MTAKKAIVLAADGLPEQLQTGDTLEGATGGGTPAGADGEIQFNNNGAFGTVAGFGMDADRVFLENVPGIKNPLQFSIETDGFYLFQPSTGSSGGLTVSAFDGFQANDLSAVGCLFYSNGPVKLTHANPDSFAESILSIDATGAAVIDAETAGIGTSNTAGQPCTFKAGGSTGNQDSKIELWTAKAGATGTGARAAAARVTLLGDRLGVNTASPSANIDVLGTARFGDHATNYAEFSATGTLRLNGSATVWDDLRIEPTIKTAGTNDPAFELYVRDAGATTIGVWTYSFDNASSNNQKEVYFQVQMPHNWKEGSSVYPHVHWVPKTAGTAGHKVRWGLEYTKASIGSAFGNTTTIYADTTVAGAITTALSHCLTSFAEVSMTGNTLSTVIWCRVFRDSANAADTATITAGLLYIDWHYEIDALGSESELTK